MGQHNSSLFNKGHQNPPAKEDSCTTKKKGSGELRQRHHDITGKLVVEGRDVTERLLRTPEAVGSEPGEVGQEKIHTSIGTRKNPIIETEEILTRVEGVTSDRKSDNSSSWGPVTKSTAEPAPYTGLEYIKWGCVSTDIRFHLKGPTYLAFLDTYNEVSVIDRAWLKKHHPNVPILNSNSQICTLRTQNSFNDCSEYIVLRMYFQGVDKEGRRALGLVEREVHLVDDLPPKLLLGIDMMVMERMDIIISEKKAVLHSCGITVDIEIEKAALGRERIPN